MVFYINILIFIRKYNSFKQRLFKCTFTIVVWGWRWFGIGYWDIQHKHIDVKGIIDTKYYNIAINQNLHKFYLCIFSSWGEDLIFEKNRVLVE